MGHYLLVRILSLLPLPARNPEAPSGLLPRLTEPGWAPGSRPRASSSGVLWIPPRRPLSAEPSKGREGRAPLAEDVPPGIPWFGAWVPLQKESAKNRHRGHLCRDSRATLLSDEGSHHPARLMVRPRQRFFSRTRPDLLTQISGSCRSD